MTIETNKRTMARFVLCINNVNPALADELIHPQAVFMCQGAPSQCMARPAIWK